MNREAPIPHSGGRKRREVARDSGLGIWRASAGLRVQPIAPDEAVVPHTRELDNHRPVSVPEQSRLRHWGRTKASASTNRAPHIRLNANDAN